jgi:hypothetical protein
VDHVESPSNEKQILPPSFLLKYLYFAAATE